VKLDECRRSDPESKAGEPKNAQARIADIAAEQTTALTNPTAFLSMA
jgi:hypothetical protein